ncbi:uncharacterized protein LOC129054735 [Pongo abelii]|uniref:uncharacterized protein LOC129054735 n=1 Tax=Pongo abelii TaxID=9601 RepID=UPI0030050594
MIGKREIFPPFSPLSLFLTVFSPLLFSPPSSPPRSSRILFCPLPTVFFPHLLLPGTFFPSPPFSSSQSLRLLAAPVPVASAFPPISLSPSPRPPPPSSPPARFPSPPSRLFPQQRFPAAPSSPLPLPLLTVFARPITPNRFLPHPTPFSSHFFPLSRSSVCLPQSLPILFSSPHRLLSQPLILHHLLPLPTILFPFPSPHLLAAATSCRAFLSPQSLLPSSSPHRLRPRSSSCPLPSPRSPTAFPLEALHACAPVSLPPVCLCAQAAPSAGPLSSAPAANWRPKRLLPVPSRLLPPPRPVPRLAVPPPRRCFRTEKGWLRKEDSGAQKTAGRGGGGYGEGGKEPCKVGEGERRVGKKKEGRGNIQRPTGKTATGQGRQSLELRCLQSRNVKDSWKPPEAKKEILPESLPKKSIILTPRF